MLNIKIDWLQLACYGKITELDEFTYEYQDKRTKEFNNLLDVFKNNKKICTIAYEPTSNILRADLLLIKFDNEFLYSCNIIVFAKFFCKKHDFFINNITRIDFCTDFNYLYNGLKPQCLIKGILKNKYLANMRMNERFEGIQKKHHTFHYLKYGSHKSLVSSYLYNKTKEMREKEWKPWIFDSWKDKNLLTEMDIWRLEFSVHPSRFDFIPLDSKNNSFEIYKSYVKKMVKSGTLEYSSYDDFCLDNQLTKVNRFKFNIDYLLEFGAINTIFQSLLDRYFHFKINKHKRNKSENPDKQLFIKNINNGVFYINDINKTSNRSDKIFMNKLAKYNDEIKDDYPDLSEAIKFVGTYIIDTRKLMQKENG